MKLGLSIFPTDYSIGPAELAKLTEERGFESIWFPEHTHIPVSPAHCPTPPAASCRRSTATCSTPSWR